MYLYKVWVGTPKYHGVEPLTYACDKLLATGTIVEVPLKNTLVLGFVHGKHVTKPKFTAKPLQRFFKTLLVPEAQRKLHTWLLEYYPAPSGVITQLFIPGNLPQKITLEKSDNNQSTVNSSNLTLTSQQEAVIGKITAPGSSAVSILHGETSSGKTQVYIELAKKAIAKNQSAIILTPEIGLTPQLLHSLQETFGDRVIVTHSQLTSAQRRTIWLKLAQESDRPWIVLGPRSALFSPLQNIGVIVLDEAHDNSYKQDQSPYYQAQRVAAKLAMLAGAKCILGSATPRVSDYYSFLQHASTITRMDKPVHDKMLPSSIKVIDRTDKSSFTKSFLFSDFLLKQIAQTIDQNQQSLLFLNRRGTARLVVCESCGWQAQCPHCDIPLVYHKDQHALRCHICGIQQNPPTNCVECKNTEIVFQAAGSKALEEELAKHFPYAKIMRFDSDTPTKSALHKQYDAINKGEIDILVGTQILAKGLHLPRLTLVGIPFADSSLYLPDFTSEEQTYQLLTQVMGRVGRTNKESQVIVQSYNPQNPAIQAAVRRDWQTFYDSQIVSRKTHKLPPFYSLLQLTVSRKQDASAQQAAAKLADDIQTKYKNNLILGPSPAFRHKSTAGYRWQVVVKSKNRQTLAQIIKYLPSGWHYNIDPINLL